MAEVLPFSCVRPRADLVQEVAALPYDVYNLAEARAEIEKHPHSFLRIDMAEAMLPDTVGQNDDLIYATARALLDKDIADGVFIAERDPHYYLYRLTTADGQSQTGIMGCASIDDYLDGTIKKHEKTKPDKEIDRIRHVDTCNAHTGPIFLATRSNDALEQVMDKVSTSPMLYDFTADDGVRHSIWRVDNTQDTATIRQSFDSIPALYIADGHHRTASAVKVGLLRREKAHAEALEQSKSVGREAGAHPVPQSIPSLASDHFLSIIFPSSQLRVLDYNRVIADLNGLTVEQFLDRIRVCFEVSEPQKSPAKPERKGSFGMYVDESWYRLSVKEGCTSDDPVTGLDVAILQDRILEPLLGIEDPRTDKRIDFVGGVRGMGELECRVKSDMAVAFALYPTSIEELFAVADAGLLMPPKSTWFEPKPRSGIFIHRM